MRQLPVAPNDGTWGKHSIRIINDVLASHPDASDAEILILVWERYPFGARENHPYKIWLKKVALLKDLLAGRGATGQRKAPALADTPLFGRNT